VPLSFRLSTFRLGDGAASVPENLRAFASECPTLAAEAVTDEQGHTLLLISGTFEDPRYLPDGLRCWLAFSDHVPWCDLTRQVGFPTLEACFEWRADNTLLVNAPRYVDDAAAGAAVLREGLLLTLNWGQPIRARAARRPAHTRYITRSMTPDAGRPAEFVQSTLVRWHVVRTAIRTLDPAGSGFAAAPARCPPLADLITQPLTAVAAWEGELTLPAEQTYALRSTGERRSAPKQLDRERMFGVPQFRFDDVEIVGFRLTLDGREGSSDPMPEFLRQVERQLNGAGLGSDDFEYRVASRRVVVELLRYGRMRLSQPWPPLAAGDYQCQHELLVRVLVGRVDDDGAQARDAAVHVPAIFVDNPWSKALGRDLQGFPKNLARFCIDGGPDGVQPLRMDGCRDDSVKESLLNVTSVRQVQDLRSRAATQPVLLRLGYSPEVDRSDEGFEPVDLSALAGSALLSRAPWRQADFDDAEFRRAFAQPVLRRGFTGFRSIQVAPVDGRLGQLTCIHGTLAMEDIRVQFPSGFATLEWPEDCSSAPTAWSALRDALGPRAGRLSLPAGSWYRARCNITLSIDAGLDW